MKRHRPKHRVHAPASVVADGTGRATARPSSLAACGPTDWRGDFRAAMSQTRTTFEMIADVLKCSRQNVQHLIDPHSGRRLTLDHLESLLAQSTTAACVRVFYERQRARFERRNPGREEVLAELRQSFEASLSRALTSLRGEVAGKAG